MLKPSVQIHAERGFFVAEFWDCLRLDPAPIQELRTKYEAHLRSGGRAELVIDLLGVGFAGSAALGHFVALHRIARGKNGRLIFCNVDPTVFEVFKVSKLDVLFTFCTDRDAAIREVEHPSAHAGHAAAAPSDPAVPTPPPAPRPQGGGLISSRRRKLS